MRFFLTALISSMTITTATLSIPLYYHNRNRTSQALILRQQTQLLTTTLVQDEPSITQRLRFFEAAKEKQSSRRKKGSRSDRWTTEEGWKDLWNEEVIRRAAAGVVSWLAS